MGLFAHMNETSSFWTRTRAFTTTYETHRPALDHTHQSSQVTALVLQMHLVISMFFKSNAYN